MPACPPQLLVVAFFTSSALLPSLTPLLYCRWRTHIVVGMKLMVAAMCSNIRRPQPMLAELPRANPVSALLQSIMGLQVGVAWVGGLPNNNIRQGRLCELSTTAGAGVWPYRLLVFLWLAFIPSRPFTT